MPDAAGSPRYVALYGDYAEFCAVSQILKRPGFGADIRGEIGGHGVFFLHGACRDRDAHYPVLKVCEDDDPDGGVGLSMNAHFRNAKWAAFDDREFFLHGGLRPGERLTRARYLEVRAAARRRSFYDGIDFHESYFAEMPAGFDREDWKYEISVGTDYGVNLARGTYCARVPVTPAQMAKMVDYLNRENAPYREGKRVFHWDLFRDNCVRMAHDALAEAGVWQPWGGSSFWLFAMFNFPVPRNEFVNLAQRANDLPIDDLEAMYEDVAARRMVAEFGRLPTADGSLASSSPPWPANDVYQTTGLSLIFYDDPTFGSYQRRFDRIFGTTRYFDLRANLEHFRQVYAAIEAERRPLAWWLARRGGTSARQARFAAFYAGYYDAVAREKAAVETRLAALGEGNGGAE